MGGMGESRGGDLGVGEGGGRGPLSLGAGGPLRLPEGGGSDFSQSPARVPHPELVPGEAPVSGVVGGEPRAEVS